MAQRCLVLFKGEHRYVFRVDIGSEERFLASLPDLVADGRCNLDWQDVAFLRRLVDNVRMHPTLRPADARFLRSRSDG